ncbi:MAG: MopE-related protein, partial [Patescibacteria group bacterium]
MRKNIFALSCFLYSLALAVPAWAGGFLSLPINEKAPVITAHFCDPDYIVPQCHRGTDYDTTDNATTVFTSAVGTVKMVVDQYPSGMCKKCGFGNHVRILHDNRYLTIYGHLLRGSLKVKAGQEISAGEQIATADHSGFSTGSHLHFEVRDTSGTAVDPYGANAKYPQCGANPLWATCPPTPYEPPQDVDADNDGFLASQGDCNDKDASINPTAKEVCDTIDNDCDDKVDEPFKPPLIKATAAALGNSCTVGRGACARNGEMVCTADGKATACSVDAGKPVVEICDGLDNNCDDETDENCPCTPLGAQEACGTDEGVCTFGTKTCGSTGWSACSGNVRPNSEICDGLDNNCDGETDETYKEPLLLAAALGKPCTVGKGSCQNTGQMVCTADKKATVCSVDVGNPIAEICGDAADNDCDGETDEKNACPDQPPVTDAPISGIIPGTFSYTGGVFALHVSPLDPEGNLIANNVTVKNFSFSSVAVASYDSPAQTVTTGQAAVDSIEIKETSSPGKGSTLLMLFDSSGSMSSNDPQRQRVEAGKRFVDAIGGDDRAVILDFGVGPSSGLTASRLLQDITGDKNLLKNAIDQVQENGNTPLYDSILDGLGLV